MADRRSKRREKGGSKRRSNRREGRGGGKRRGERRGERRSKRRGERRSKRRGERRRRKAEKGGAINPKREEHFRSRTLSHAPTRSHSYKILHTLALSRMQAVSFLVLPLLPHPTHLKKAVSLVHRRRAGAGQRVFRPTPVASLR
jgi:hypothetical protein